MDNGSDIPVALVGRLVSPWLATRDADWWVDKLDGFATDLGATTIRTRASRRVIDVNGDPSGASLCNAGPFSRVTYGRFRGGSITRHYGRPEMGINAIQMELACRGSIHDPAQALEPATWTSPYDPKQAEPLRATLQAILIVCLTFTETPSPS